MRSHRSDHAPLSGGRSNAGCRRMKSKSCWRGLPDRRHSARRIWTLRWRRVFAVGGWRSCLFLGFLPGNDNPREAKPTTPHQAARRHRVDMLDQGTARSYPLPRQRREEKGNGARADFRVSKRTVRRRRTAVGEISLAFRVKRSQAFRSTLRETRGAAPSSVRTRV